MKAPEIDESKMSEVMELIEKAASIMEENQGSEDPEAKRELRGLQRRLREVTGNKKLKISQFQQYWSYTSLETMAKRALRLPPQKCDVTDEQIKKIVVTVFSGSYIKENADIIDADMDYWLKFLEVNTGLENLSDYIFYPDLVGMERSSSLEQIADRIIADRIITDK